MYCLNHRVGILFRQNMRKKSYELRYFFIDGQGNLFYIANLPKLQKVIRVSKDLQEIRVKLIKIGQKSLNLHKYDISKPKNYVTEAVLPFSNRISFDIKEKDAKNQERAYQIFGLIDQDTALIYEEIMCLLGMKKKVPTKRKSLIDQEKEKEEMRPYLLLESFLKNQETFLMSEEKEGEENQESDNQYAGQKQNGKADGKGKQILLSKGITFNGNFKGGKKHGQGYIVNENLDMLQCQFLNDRLAGI